MSKSNKLALTSMHLPDFLQSFKANYHEYSIHDNYNILDASLLLLNIDVESYLAHLLKINQLIKFYGGPGALPHNDSSAFIQIKGGIFWPAYIPPGSDHEFGLGLQNLNAQLDLDESNIEQLSILVKGYCKLCQKILQSKLVFDMKPVKFNQVDDPRSVSLRLKSVVSWALENGIAVESQLKKIILNNKSSEMIQEDSDKEHGNVEQNAKKREAVLKAAVAVLAKYYTDCLFKNGKVAPSKITTLIEQKAHEFWPEQGTPPLTNDAISRLISDCIKDKSVDSGAKLPPNPDENCHSFHSKAATSLTTKF